MTLHKFLTALWVIMAFLVGTVAVRAETVGSALDKLEEINSMRESMMPMVCKSTAELMFDKVAFIATAVPRTFLIS